MTMTTELGTIAISQDVIATLAGYAAMGCFGVKAMTVKSVSDGIVHLLRRDHMRKGVIISERDNKTIDIELHIAVEHGVNIQAVCRSITNEVRYHTERLTGVHIGNIDICVDSIRMR